MGNFERFEEIEAWKEARLLVREVYGVTNDGQFARDFGLRDQIRRAAISVMSNIAEGFERGGDSEFFQFLSIAKGSCGEVRSQLYVALDQDYISDGQHVPLMTQAVKTSRLVSGLMRYLRSSDYRGNKFKQPATVDPP